MDRKVWLPKLGTNLSDLSKDLNDSKLILSSSKTNYPVLSCSKSLDRNPLYFSELKP